MLRLEQLWHLRAAAFHSNDGEKFGPEYHSAVANWLESVLSGALKNWGEKAEEALKSEDEKSATLTSLLTSTQLQEQDSGGDYLTE